MTGIRGSLIFPIALMLGGVAAFFLYLYLVGHDPDETSLTVVEWMIGGMLIGPGFYYLLRWRQLKDSRRAKAD